MQTTHFPKREQLKMPARKFKPQKPKGWSHQQDLLESVGKNIMLLLNNSVTVVGVLVAADAYTIKINAAGFIAVYNKSALTYFAVEG